MLVNERSVDDRGTVTRLLLYFQQNWKFTVPATAIVKADNQSTRTTLICDLCTYLPTRAGICDLKRYKSTSYSTWAHISIGWFGLCSIFFSAGLRTRHKKILFRKIVPLALDQPALASPQQSLCKK